MGTVYMVFGKNAVKEWPVVAYACVHATKKHYVKLQAAVKENQERIGRGEEPIVTKYDASNNIATEYFVLTTTAHMTFEGWKAYMQIDEYSPESIEESVKSL